MLGDVPDKGSNFGIETIIPDDDPDDRMGEDVGDPSRGQREEQEHALGGRSQSSTAAFLSRSSHADSP